MSASERATQNHPNSRGEKTPERHPGFGGRRRNGAMIDVSWAISQPPTSSSDEEGEEDEGEARTQRKINRKKVESPQDVKVSCNLQESQVKTRELASC